MSTIAIRVDDELKEKATELYTELGIPFEIKDSSADDLLNKRLTDLIMENAETVKTIDLDNSD